MEMSTDKHDDCCTDTRCDSGRRNRYYSRKRITPDTWQVEQNYQQQRRHLLNRAIHGWGVVYGLALDIEKGNPCSDDGEQRVMVKPGLALDPCGRELLQVEKQPLDLNTVLIFDAQGKLVDPPEDRCRRTDKHFPWGPEAEKYCVLLRAHYAERSIAPVAIRDPCQCEQQEWDQVCETVCYSVTPIDCEKCCRQFGCKLECECSRGPCCPEGDSKPSGRGGCRCLCEHLLQLNPTPECCSLTTLSKGLKVDLHNGVPLACLRLARDRCGDWTFGGIADACGPRRLVKRNDLLFDLIRGCDLTHISEIGWADWHRAPAPIDFDAFEKSFGTANGQGAHVTEKYWVRFSKPVQVATIKRECFTMTVIAREDIGGWGRMLRVPIVDVEVEDPDNTGYSSFARILVNSSWAGDEISGGVRVFESAVARVEIAVRGDYLLDCNGQAVDANARGLSAAPTGNGTPGDTFISTFLVSQKPASNAGIKPSYTGM